jgi:predicted membrane protein (TIGR00267 family)
MDEETPCENSPLLAPAPTTHLEKHTAYTEQLSNVIIGLADGLTVPFALTAGLTAYVAASNPYMHEAANGYPRVGSIRLIIIGGLAELFAGAISMGLGAWLAAETERKHYEVEEAREFREVKNMPQKEEEEIYEIFEQYGISRSAAKGVVDDLTRNEDMWVKVRERVSKSHEKSAEFSQFMMQFELKLEKPDTSKSWISAFVMGLSYFLGGLVPMLPYFFMRKVNDALLMSIGITAVILLVFGYVKAIITGTGRRNALLSAVQTLVVGALAAGASYGIVRGINEKTGDAVGT